jgi:hypothetical protein
LKAFDQKWNNFNEKWNDFQTPKQTLISLYSSSDPNSYQSERISYDHKNIKFNSLSEGCSDCYKYNSYRPYESKND